MSTRTLHILDSFLCYIAEECGKRFREDGSLADYIDYWLWDRGAADCYGDFEIFLKVIPLVVDEWYRNPAILHFGGSKIPEQSSFERRATSAFGGNDEQSAIFDRDNFTAAWFDWKYLRACTSKAPHD
jgi:hypothetical protein